ncbi:DUF2584 domain-containing protein [Rossellomorea sp. BNER]|uniref:DUF2584 domain-containing protein n=1 Tax=Rossellomorea sp. BNER TaxID=2962031 RepID=UPI003AF22C6B|nr:DUF2584 domain-containing protein [Rossellomorea sp. BNER]
MGMGLELNTMIVTKNNESRAQESDNVYILVKEGYRLYPMEIPIEVRKTKGGEIVGTGIIKQLRWEDKMTYLTYELVSLKSTN